MAGRGRAPKPPEVRTNHIDPLRGEWQSHPGHALRAWALEQRPAAGALTTNDTTT